ncbi:helix-turn-helix transcriptional regulator [Baekduia sp. Peel2402]|uniref:helix-turn-helix transcriptional regulator n=1 Tax=Baekduia sp. Peel2402 TaxID=3458296 RepID=UPI00403ED4FB
MTHGEVVAAALNLDGAFRSEWERLAPARMVAAKLIEYRYDHDLSQRDLATLIGVKQPQVARWESGESLPRPESLVRLAGKLSIEFVFSYAPADREPKQITRKTCETAGAYAEGDGVARFAAVAR